MASRDSRTAHVVAWEQRPWPGGGTYLSPFAFLADEALTLCGRWITPARHATGVTRCGRCLVRLFMDPRTGKHRRRHR
jgi:hypothetical protein